MTDLPTISLFSGVGGLDLGAHNAGFEIRAAVEFDPDSARSLRVNRFADEPDRVVTDSIVDVSTERLLAISFLRAGEPALVIGGPPCTPFSKSGYWLEYKRKGLDPNASLLDDYVRVVAEARPAAALLENVHGLAYNNHNTKPFERLLERLRVAGYRTRAGVLNMADYGIPQLRKRLIVYAVRGADPPPFPRPTHSGWTERNHNIDPTKLPYVTSGEVIGDLAGREDLAESGEIVGGQYGHLLPGIPPGDNYLFYTEKRGHPKPLFRWRGRYWTFLLKLDPDRPSSTIQSQPGPYIGPFHWDNRRLRVLEVKRLQTFPDEYHVSGTRRSVQVQLGNAVPPKFAEIVARPLADMLLGRQTTSDEPEQLLLAV